MNQRHRLIFFGFPTPFCLKKKDSGCPGAQLYPLLSTARIMSESWRGCGDHSALNLTDGGQTWNCGTERRVKPLLLASPIASMQTSMCTVFCMSDINLYCRRFTFWKVTSKLANGVSRFQVFVKLHFFRLHIAKALHHRCHLLTSTSYIPSSSSVCSVRSGPFGVIGGVYGGLLSHGVWALRVFIRVECWIAAKVMQDFQCDRMCMPKPHWHVDCTLCAWRVKLTIFSQSCRLYVVHLMPFCERL